jgi:hypothetical protein
VRLRQLYCATCEAEMEFEVPRCVDGHGDDCPELVCTGCGTAVFSAPLTGQWPPARVARRPRVSPHRRHAA